MRARTRHAWYTRAELTTKDILNAGGRHPPGVLHFHPLSRVGALTAAMSSMSSNHAPGASGLEATCRSTTCRRTWLTTTVRRSRFICSCGIAPSRDTHT